MIKLEKQQTENQVPSRTRERICLSHARSRQLSESVALRQSQWEGRGWDEMGWREGGVDRMEEWGGSVSVCVCVWSVKISQVSESEVQRCTLLYGYAFGLNERQKRKFHSRAKSLIVRGIN